MYTDTILPTRKYGSHYLNYSITEAEKMYSRRSYLVHLALSQLSAWISTRMESWTERSDSADHWNLSFRYWQLWRPETLSSSSSFLCPQTERSRNDTVRFGLVDSAQKGMKRKRKSFSISVSGSIRLCYFCLQREVSIYQLFEICAIRPPRIVTQAPCMKTVSRGTSVTVASWMDGWLAGWQAIYQSPKVAGYLTKIPPWYCQIRRNVVINMP